MWIKFEVYNKQLVLFYIFTLQRQQQNKIQSATWMAMRYNGTMHKLCYNEGVGQRQRGVFVVGLFAVGGYGVRSDTI